MKKRVLLFIALLSSIYSFSQNHLTGKIVDEGKQPIAGATVIAKQKNKTTSVVAATDGTFEIKDLKNSVVEITVSLVGFENSYERILLNGNKVITVELIANANQLQSVEVVGRSAKKYTSDYSYSATRTAILNKDLPQSIGTVTKELIADRQAF